MSILGKRRLPSLLVVVSFAFCPDVRCGHLHALRQFYALNLSGATSNTVNFAWLVSLGTDKNFTSVVQAI